MGRTQGHTARSICEALGRSPTSVAIYVDLIKINYGEANLFEVELRVVSGRAMSSFFLKQQNHSRFRMLKCAQQEETF